jgi:hypothetical protein
VDPLGLLRIILLKDTDPNYKSAMDDPDDPATCTVYSHGSSKTVSGMNAQQLNALLKKRGCKPKQPVKLDACRTGQGEDSIGEQLAKRRKGTVIAPDQPVWDLWWGSSPYPPMSEDMNSKMNTVPNLARPGNWVTFDGRK